MDLQRWLSGVGSTRAIFGREIATLLHVFILSKWDRHSFCCKLQVWKPKKESDLLNASPAVNVKLNIIWIQNADTDLLSLRVLFVRLYRLREQLKKWHHCTYVRKNTILKVFLFHDCLKVRIQRLKKYPHLLTHYVFKCTLKKYRCINRNIIFKTNHSKIDQKYHTTYVSSNSNCPHMYTYYL
jgi:hypothetical protein